MLVDRSRVAVAFDTNFVDINNTNFSAYTVAGLQSTALLWRVARALPGIDLNRGQANWTSTLFQNGASAFTDGGVYALQVDTGRLAALAPADRYSEFFFALGHNLDTAQIVSVPAPTLVNNAPRFITCGAPPDGMASPRLGVCYGYYLDSELALSVSQIQHIFYFDRFGELEVCIRQQAPIPGVPPDPSEFMKFESIRRLYPDVPLLDPKGPIAAGLSSVGLPYVALLSQDHLRVVLLVRFNQAPHDPLHPERSWRFLVCQKLEDRFHETPVARNLSTSLRQPFFGFTGARPQSSPRAWARGRAWARRTCLHPETEPWAC